MRRLLLGTALFTIVAATVLTAPAMAVDKIYFTTPYTGTSRVYVANLDGSAAPVPLVPTTAGNPWGLAIDTTTERIYWGTYFGNKISFSKLDGTGQGDLVTGAATVQGPTGVVIDRSSNKIYWANFNGVKISWAMLDGSGGGDLNTGTATVVNPMGVAIDTADGKIYWANYGGDKVSFAKLDNTGGGDLNIIGTTVNDPWGVTIDSATSRVFWGNYQTNALDFASLDGTGGGILATPGAAQLGPMPGAIDTDTGKIYWSNWNNPSGIMFASKDGTGGNGTLYPIPGGGLVQPAMPIVLKSPRGTAAPAITAPGPTTPTTLSCSRGSWGADLAGEHLYRSARSFDYSWTLNGSPVGGATSASLAASATGDYRCTVTARNFAGATSQTSAAFAVTPPPPPPPPPPPRLGSTASISSLAFPTYTKLVNLSVKNLPASATVRVTCKTKKKKKQKKGCPFKSKTYKSTRAGARLNLRKPFRNRKVPVGTKVTITINAPGFLGKRITYTMRARKLPKSLVQCFNVAGKLGRC